MTFFFFDGSGGLSLNIRFLDRRLVHAADRVRAQAVGHVERAGPDDEREEPAQVGVRHEEAGPAYCR